MALAWAPMQNAQQISREYQDGAGLRRLIPILGPTADLAACANTDDSHTSVGGPVDGVLNLRKILQAGGLSQSTVLSDIVLRKSHPSSGEHGEELFSVVAPPSVLVPKPNPGEISLAQSF